MDNLTPQYPTYTKQTAPFPRKILFFILVLILLGAGLLAGKQFMSDTAEEVIPTPTIAPEPTLTPEPPTATPELSPTTTPAVKGKITPTNAPTTAATGKIDPKRAITVDVLNGSGTVGAASKMATFLKNLGYTIGTTGNADSFEYANIVLQVKKSKSTFLSQLKTDLASEYTVGSTSATLAETSSADAIVIIGK